MGRGIGNVGHIPSYEKGCQVLLSVCVPNAWYFTGDDGETYWHILDPETGRPAHSGLVSVTVIGKEGRLCDALSTSLFVMGLDKATEIWKQRDDFEMILVSDKGGIYLTEGIEENFSLNQMYGNLETEVIHR